MRPRQALQRPLIIGIFRPQLYAYLAQHRVIVRRFVMAHATPVDRFSSKGGVGVGLADVGINLFGVGPFLVHERHASQIHFQTSAKPILWQVTFDAVTLHTIGVQNENGRRPKCVEAMEPCGMFFDVGFQRNKVVMDEVGDFCVAV